MIVEKLIPGGQALATLPDGKKLFLWNALPGETVDDYRITKNKTHYAEAIALSISHPSPHRVMPVDSCYLSTSPWQIMSEAYELEYKQAIVKELFREHQILIETPAIFTDHQIYHYRNKMEYSLYWDHDTGQIQLAFHLRGSHGKLPISQSSIERPEIFQAAMDIVGDLNLRHDEARRYQSLLLRTSGNGQVSGGLYEKHQPHPIFPPLTDTILGHPYSYSPNGFFQINLPVYELALKAMKPYITTGPVLDLYSGVGTIGLSIARDHELTLVECDHSAYQELEANCRGVSRATPVLAKSEAVPSFITPLSTVILDPPRAGCHESLLERLLEVTPPTIIYLSCNPATQARDLRTLLTKYRLATVQTFNFFPRTPHIENLVVLSRQN